jgi:glycosyltransferase involved in cell wall biosynthesis
VKPPPNILIYSPTIRGGLAEYVFCQAAALEKSGMHVTCLVAPSFLSGRKAKFKQVICLKDPPAENGWRLLKRVKMAWQLVANNFRLAWHIWQYRPDLVLLDSYVEYFAPIWIWPHWILARFYRIRFAANLHDPVRSHRVGPAWWHNFSVRLAYLPLDFVLVHNQLPAPSPVPARVRIVQVPHGIYEVPMAPEPSIVRREWGVPAGKKVFLAFGYIRDGKNLDLAMRALAEVPEAFLVVAGSVASPKDKPFTFYRELAVALGIIDRCRFFEGFVADADLGKYFAGADVVLLTYASTFHSQSGVLNIAARARKPVLASASPSPLVESVKNFQLGVTVEPDSSAAMLAGIKYLLTEPPKADWEAYEASASWSANAQGLLQAAGLSAGTKFGK